MQDASVFTAYLDKYSRLQASKYQVKLFQLIRQGEQVSGSNDNASNLKAVKAISWSLKTGTVLLGNLQLLQNEPTH